MKFTHYLAGAAFVAASACATTGQFTTTSLMSLHALYEANPDAPRAQKVDGDSHKEYVHRLAAIAGRHGIRVMTGQIQDPDDAEAVYWGFYRQDEHLIAIDTRLTPNEQVVALVHEMGHAFGPHLPMPQDDIVAQAISYIVCQQLKLDVGSATMAYYTADPKFDAMVDKVLMVNAKAIEATATLILEELKRTK
jgi:hypothetical protein